MSRPSDPGDSTTHRISGEAQTRFTFDVTCGEPGSVVTGAVHVTGEGSFTRLGRSTLTIEETALFACTPDGPVPVQVLTALGRYVAADGDVLETEAESVTPVDAASLTFSSRDRVLGGTGRFAGATGALDGTVVIHPGDGATLTVTGTLTLPRRPEHPLHPPR